MKKQRQNTASLVSDVEINFLREQYPRVKNREELTSCFNLKFNLDYTVCQVRGILCRHEIKSGRTGRFVHGHMPWITKEKGTGRVKKNRGSFVKGNIPANSKTLHTERINIEGYIEIKVAENNPYTTAKTRYKQKHIWLWEQHHGKIRKGCCIVFSDSNRLNCTLSNLAELSRAENLSRNRLKSNRVPNAFRETKNLMYKLQCKMKKAKKRV